MSQVAAVLFTMVLRFSPRMAEGRNAGKRSGVTHRAATHIALDAAVPIRTCCAGFFGGFETAIRVTSRAASPFQATQEMLCFSSRLTSEPDTGALCRRAEFRTEE